MSQEESDEEDYMSDAFLQKCADPRPGLVPKHVARQLKTEAKHKEANVKSKSKPRQVLEKEKREEGLSKTIDTKNKGFALLQKMGYKPGMSLGKKGDGRSEPVPISVKLGRGGLGREQDMKRKKEEMDAMRVAMMRKRMKRNELRGHEYRQALSDKFLDQEIEKDLYKSQKVCMHLDQEKGLTEPNELIFWPAAYLNMKKTQEEVEDEEDDSEDSEEEEPLQEIPAADKLEIITAYLRKTYLYCVWCGTSFNDKDDMQSNCPGKTAEAHR